MNYFNERLSLELQQRTWQALTAYRKPIKGVDALELPDSAAIQKCDRLKRIECTWQAVNKKR